MAFYCGVWVILSCNFVCLLTKRKKEEEKVEEGMEKLQFYCMLKTDLRSLRLFNEGAVLLLLLCLLK